MPRLAGDIPYRLLGGGQPTQACNRSTAALANPQSKNHHNVSMLFDGSDSASLSSDVDLDITNSWTIMIWLSPGDLSPLSDQMIYSIGTLDDAGKLNAVEILIETGGTFACKIFNNTGVLVKKRAVDGFFFDTNVWHQIVLTWDGATMTVYRNGVNMNPFMSNITDVAGSQTNTNRAITVGSSFVSGDQMVGVVHSAAHWNTALTQSEIVSVYNSGRGGDFDLNLGQEAYTSQGSLRSWYQFGSTPSQSTVQNKAPGGFALTTTQALSSITRSAPEGGFISFDGFMELSAAAASLGVGSSLTVAAWARCNSLPDEGDVQNIVRFMATFPNADQIALSITTVGGSSFWVFEVSDSTDTVTNTVVGDTPVVEGAWYHIVGCKNGAFSIRFFVNGVDDATPVVSGVAVTSSVDRETSVAFDRRLGAPMSGPLGVRDNFVGDIHSIALWSIPITENGVRAVYSGGWANLDISTTHPSYPEAPFLTHWWVLGIPDVSFASDVPDLVGSITLEDVQSTIWQEDKLSVTSALLGTSANFDNVSGLGTPTALPVGIANSFTISAWMFPRNTTTDTQIVLYIGPEQPSAANSITWKIEGDVANDPFSIEVRNSAGAVIRRRNFVDMLTPNEWQHVAMVWTGSEINVWYNGIFNGGVVVDSGSGVTIDASRFVELGGSTKALAEPEGLKFDGLVSHVGVWDTQLGENEIATIASQAHSIDLRYNKDDYANAESLQHYYKLGEDTFFLGRDFINTMRGIGLLTLSASTGSVASIGDAPANKDVVITSPFSPDDLADLSLWLDAADVSTISTTGDLLDQWDDKSLAGITGNFTPWDNSQKCNYGLVGDRINGLNVVNFPQIGFPTPGSELALQGTSTTSLKGVDGMSVFGVIEADNTQYLYTTTTYSTSMYTTTFTNEQGSWLYKGINNVFQVEYVYTPTRASYSKAFSSGSPPTGNNVGMGSSTLNPAILSVVLDATAAQTVATGYRDGALQETVADFEAYNDNAAPNQPYPHMIGAHLQPPGDNVIIPFVGSIAEIIVYSRNLSDMERGQVHTYLSNKWGIALLP